MKAWQNLGETNNKGIELLLNTQNFVKKNFTWSSNITFTANKEKIVSLPDGDVKAEKLFEGDYSKGEVSNTSSFMGCTASRG